MAKQAKKRKQRLEERRAAYAAVASRPGFRRPGSMNPKKR